MLVVGGITVTQAPSQGRRSFSSSMIASALSKFHGLKDPGQAPHRMVATSVQVGPAGTVTTAVGAAQQASKDDQTKTKPDALPKKDGPPPGKPPVKADVKAADPKTPDAKAGDQKAGDQKAGDQKNTNQQPATTTGGAGTGTATTQEPGTFSQIYSNADLKDTIGQIVLLTGVNINIDESIKDTGADGKGLTISLKFDNETVEGIVSKLATALNAYWFKDSPTQYLISKAPPDSPAFVRIAVTGFYQTKNLPAANIQAVLSATYKNYISVDPKTNQIGVRAPKLLFDKIMDDIKMADRAVQQLDVEALVTEVSVTDTLNTAFSFQKGKFQLGADLSILGQFASFSDMAKIEAAVGNHKMNLRARPHVTAINGREATVNVGQDTYYSILSGSTLYPTTQIQLIHTGITLKFTGMIGDDGMITMQLDPTVSDSVVSVNGNPTSNIRSASTTVRVKSGQPIVIAGLVQDVNDRQVVRVPVLGYIPILGEIFTQRTHNKKKVETIFIITPRIVEGP